MGRTDAARSPVWALAVITTLLCVVAGLVSGRPDTVALAAPFAVLALAGRAGPIAGSACAVRIAPDGRTEARGPRLRLLLAPREADSAPDAGRLVVTTLAAPGCPPEAVVLLAGEECPLLVDAPPSGERDVLAYGAAGFGADLARPSAFAAAPPVRVSILPPIGATLARPVSRRLTGLAGTHRSGRPGDGGELRSVAPLQPGDALRRIDWRATARRSTDQDRIMVRRSFADAEASVLLVVDQAHDLPSSTADWFAAAPPRLAAGSLHVARTAAATVAASYLSVGDRVGLDDLSGTRRALRSAAGARHLEQIRVRLAGTAVVPRRRRRRDPVPPQGAVVVVFSAFLDAEPARLLRLWHSQGHVVAGVDCMAPLDRTETTAAQAGAVRFTLLRRRLLLEGLQDDGIAVIAGATADAQLTSRRADAPDRADGLGAPSGPDLDTGFRLLARHTERRAGQGSGRRMP
ncbi:DUF58 domain-containing protein [Arthrobacter sp. L77]|uniref:DUF58 domain-containing protein n=1 Tax=Arthrobacter sp. L77 TaxID=1496689 RepID=UPI00068C8BE3|nr:DUF58 domain-containing protein [Arthrobacter sp. L77]